MATITGWMDGCFKDQSIKGKTGVLALKRSNEGWAGQLRACIIFGRAQLKHIAGRAGIAPEEKTFLVQKRHQGYGQ